MQAKRGKKKGKGVGIFYGGELTPLDTMLTDYCCYLIRVLIR